MSSTGAMPTPDRVRKRVAEACAFCRRRKVRLSAHSVASRASRGRD